MKRLPSIPCVPENAPFNAEQRAWLNGYLAGLFSDGTAQQNQLTTQTSAPAPARKPLLLLYGSQTGTAEALAKRLETEALAHNFAARALDMSAFNTVDWTKETRLLLVTSTWGDGDPPDNALAFWNYLNSTQVTPLSHVQFAVLALGDRNYPTFCGAGKKFDARIEALGAKRICPMAECDTSYEPTLQAWLPGLWSGLEIGSSTAAPPASAITTAPLSQPKVSDGFNRQNPFPARLLINRPLNAPGSEKDTRHFEIAIEGSGLTYEAGDALGIYPTNCPVLVSDLLATLGYDGEESVRISNGAETPLRKALLQHFQINQIPQPLMSAVAERSQDAGLRELLLPANQASLDKFLFGRDVLDLLLDHKQARFTPAELVALLRPLQPRLYSISSSPKLHPSTVHLVVAIVRYETHGRKRNGVCSTHLAERIDEKAPLPVFVQTSHGFRPPSDGTKPMIMIGPGTGVAPFRGFLQERKATGASGKNWLFFGDQKAASDFLYRDELETMQTTGFLTRLDTAFSRDQTEKVYVQNRMLENAGEFWSWLESGAHLYVCGDAKRMARDVDAALHEVIQKAGNKTADQAVEYVAQLKQDKRYQRDVY